LNGECFRLQVEIQAALVAPALQFDHAVTLPHRVTLDQRQPAGFGEQVDQDHRLVVDRKTMGCDHVAEYLVADIGPGR